MVDLVVTPANVQKGNNASTQTRIAAQAITAGQAVFVDQFGGLALAQNDVDAASAAAVGIALCDAEAGQPCVYQVGGEIDIGATMSTGEIYVVGAGAGGIAPSGDIGTGDFNTVLGVAIASDNLKMGILQSGVAAA